MQVHRFVVHSLIDDRVESEVVVHVFPATSYGRAIATEGPPAGGGWIFKWGVRGRATAHAIQNRVHATECDAVNAAQEAILAHYLTRNIRARLDPVRGAPILLFQWGAATEVDELADAMLRVSYTLEARGSAVPECTERRVTDPDPNALLRMVERQLLEHPNAQLIYFSSHGVVDRISYSTDPDAPSFPFTDLARHLSNGLQSTDVTLVLGMCKALDPRSQWLPSVSPSITRIAGFTETPLGSEVAGLLTGILLDDVDRFQAYSAAIRSAYQDGVRDGDRAEAIACMRAALGIADAQFQEAPGRLVRGRHGGDLQIVERNDGGTWDAREIAY